MSQLSKHIETEYATSVGTEMKHKEILEAVRRIITETVVPEILLLREQQSIIEQRLNEYNRKLDAIHCRLDRAPTAIAGQVGGEYTDITAGIDKVQTEFKEQIRALRKEIKALIAEGHVCYRNQDNPLIQGENGCDVFFELPSGDFQ